MPDELRPASPLPGPEELVPWWHRFSPRDLPGWQRYAIAVGLSLLVILLQRWLFETGGNRFALFYVSIVLSAWFGGLGPGILKQASFRWSLSALTFPHAMVRVMLAEQLYRAHSVLQNHPYHRE